MSAVLQKGFYGALALAVTGGIARASDTPQISTRNMVDAQGNRVTDRSRDPFLSYFGNTYTCYWPGMWECHHWWNEDGSEVFFSIQWMPEGLIAMKAIDGPHSSFIANGEWCSHNARGGNRSQDDDFKVNRAITNNNKNGCQPIVDAAPGDHWYKLHLNGDLQDQREQYTLMPGHQ